MSRWTPRRRRRTSRPPSRWPPKRARPRTPRRPSLSRPSPNRSPRRRLPRLSQSRNPNPSPSRSRNPNRHPSRVRRPSPCLNRNRWNGRSPSLNQSPSLRLPSPLRPSRFVRRNPRLRARPGRSQARRDPQARHGRARQRQERDGQDQQAARVASGCRLPEGAVGRSVAVQVAGRARRQDRCAAAGEHRLGDPAAGAALRQPAGHAGAGGGANPRRDQPPPQQGWQPCRRAARRRHSGVDGENERYVDRVDDLAIATFKGCSPLRGLPAELYDVPGGWSNFTLRYKLPG